MNKSHYTKKTQRIVEILAMNSEIEQREIDKFARRLDYVGKGKPDKMLSFLTGTLVDYSYSSETRRVTGFGEMAMYYTGGDSEIAAKIVLTSPIGRKYNEDGIEEYIETQWEELGGDTFDEMFGSIPSK